MTPLSDRALDHLARVAELPEVPGGRYRILSELGRGGMGVVFLAEDCELARRVALKVARAPASPNAVERLRREARVLAELEHPGIVPVHDVGVLADGRAFYVMKHVEGRRLDEHAQSASTAEKLRVFGRICEAVGAAHQKGVVHRDLKPANVLVGSFGEVLVLDWGVAKSVSESAGAAEVEQRTVGPHGTAAGSIVGTSGYMAPEQARAAPEALDPRADVYALGCVLTFQLTLRHPEAESGRLPALPPDVARPLRAIVVRATRAEPTARYANAGELAADIARFQAAERVSAHREGLLEKSWRIAQKHRTAILIVLAYLVMRMLLLAFGNR